jgi:hypothetical protein
MVHTTTLPFIWDNQTYYDCRGAEMDEFESKIYNTLLFVLTFALPFVSLVLLRIFFILLINLFSNFQVIQAFCYLSVGKKLLTEELINNKIRLRKSIQDQSKTKVHLNL